MSPCPQTRARIGDVTLVSTADWNSPLWTNKQHVATALHNLGVRVLFIESLAMRAPRTSAADLRRVMRRAAQLFARPRPVMEHLWTYAPPVVPFHANRAARALNRIALPQMIRAAQHSVQLCGDTLLTYSPLTTKLLDIRRYRNVVYHCVDDISAQPGMPADLIRESENALFRAADIVFCTNPNLYDRAKQHTTRAVLHSNVADFEHFAQARQHRSGPGLLAHIPEPRVLFVGAISNYKLDLDLLHRVAALRPNYHFVLVGPTEDGEDGTALQRCEALANVHTVGPQPYATLPSYLRGAAAAILPNRLNDYTKSMFPMKFFEYLAAGVPVVATPLPALLPYAHCCLLAGSPADFADALDEVVDGGGPALETRLQEASLHTYGSRTQQMLDQIAAPQGRSI